MNVITFTTGTKVWAEVRNGGVTVHTTPEYYSERMAYADAYCWVAFHKGESMSKADALVKPGDRFEAAEAVTGITRDIPAERVARAIAEAERFNLDVLVRQGTGGREYIQIGRNGCSYGQYFRVLCDCPVFRHASGPCEHPQCRNAVQFRIVANHSRGNWTGGNWAGE
jgi:hypothetical protein